jgi:uncharacterized protein YwgA
MLASIEDRNTKVFIYEPSKNYKTIPTKIPKLTASHLLLFSIKNNLRKFDKTRLQKSAFFTCLFAKEDFFKFEEYNYGPYSHAIDICSRNIKEFQDYYRIDSAEAEALAKKNLISDSVKKQLDKFAIPILRATAFVNSIPDDKTLEIIATLVAIVKKQPGIDEQHIFDRFYTWSEEKQRHDARIVSMAIHNLKQLHIFSDSLMGYEIDGTIYDSQKMLRYDE